jgi:ketosteroid isomerase-like protein
MRLLSAHCPGEAAKGENNVRALFAGWQARWGALSLQADSLRAQLIGDGKVGWAGANLDAPTSYGNQKLNLPLRALVIYEYDKKGWSIAHAHVSVGVPDELAA